MVVPSQTMYHRWLGWHAPASRRLMSVALAGLVVGSLVSLFVAWQVAVLSGWDAAALAFLITVWPIIGFVDGAGTAELALREDQSRDSARLLLLAAGTASLVAVSLALGLARQEGGATRVALITLSALTVMLSWTLVNTLFTLRYAHLYYGSPPDGIDFAGTAAAEPPDFRDFAYLAFTIGMTYQVSDTALRDRRIRHTVLVHALLSYVFGVVIVAAGVNVVSGLVGR